MLGQLESGRAWLQPGLAKMSKTKLGLSNIGPGLIQHRPNRNRPNETWPNQMLGQLGRGQAWLQPGLTNMGGTQIGVTTISLTKISPAASQPDLNMPNWNRFNEHGPNYFRLNYDKPS
eukprot:4169721-Pyramimonas_sp.AAC.1